MHQIRYLKIDDKKRVLVILQKKKNISFIFVLST